MGCQVQGVWVSQFSIQNIPFPGFPIFPTVGNKWHRNFTAETSWIILKVLCVRQGLNHHGICVSRWWLDYQNWGLPKQQAWWAWLWTNYGVICGNDIPGVWAGSQSPRLKLPYKLISLMREFWMEINVSCQREIILALVKEGKKDFIQDYCNMGEKSTQIQTGESGDL